MFAHIHSAVPGRVCANCNLTIEKSENIWFYLIRASNYSEVKDDIVLCDTCGEDKQLIHNYEILVELGE